MRIGQLIFALVFAALSFSCAATAESVDAGAESDSREAVNEAALARARSNIEKYRKGDARIRIVNAQNQPIAAANLKIKQISHDFKFGCYLKIDDLAPAKLSAYERDFARLFNFAVVGTYWDFVETKRGIEDWSWFERETALARKMNVQIEAAPVLWGTNEAGTPAWLPADKNELNEVLKNRVQSVLRRHQKLAADWEIVNEPLAPKTDYFALQGNGDYLARAFAAAREAAPQARLMINEYGVFGAVGKHNYNRERYFELIKNLLAKNVPVDVVGIQAHANGEWFEPANVAAELERYAALGKPLQITEFSAQTRDYDDRRTPLRITGNRRTGIWNDDLQAEFYREFYTVAFGSQSVEAIVTWGLDDERAWLPGIGLIGESGAPKTAYSALDKLLNQEWRTALTGAADADGVYDFRGFYGEYEIEVLKPQKSVARFSVHRNAANELTIRLKV